MAKSRGLDPRPTDAQLRAIALDRLAEGMHNGVRLGPNSPLLKGKRRDSVSAKPTKETLAGSVDVIDPAGRMNTWERQRALQLEAMKRAGEIVAWGFETVTLRLADRTTYTPDFTIVTAASGALVFEEVKGFWRDDARVKIKVAARQFPWFQFRALKRRKGRPEGWEREEVRP